MTVLSPIRDMSVPGAARGLVGHGHKGALLDWAWPSVLPRALTFSRTSTATQRAAHGALAAYAAGVPRLADGWLIEDDGANQIPNPRAEGGADGVIGSGGSLPTGWSWSGDSGVTRTRVKVDQEGGINYIRLRLSGTTGGTSSQIFFVPSNQIVAAQNDDVAAGVFVRIVDDTNIAAVTGAFLINSEYENVPPVTFRSSNPSGNLLSQIGSEFVRLPLVTQMDEAAADYARLFLQWSYTNGQPIDMTFDIGWPTWENAPFLSSPIVPPAASPAASTRDADDALVDFGASGLGSIFSFRVTFERDHADYSSDAEVVLFSDSDSSNANRIDLYINTSGELTLRILNGDAEQVTLTGPTVAADTKYTVECAVDVTFAAIAMRVNGGAWSADSAGDAEQPRYMAPGMTVTPDDHLNGTLRELSVWNGDRWRQMTFVHLANFATEGEAEADQHDNILDAYAVGREVRIRDGEWFRLTQTLTLPAGSKTRCEDPETGGFVLDMQDTGGVVFGAGSTISGLGVKSLDYLSADITNTTDYALGVRGLLAGDNCQFTDVYMQDMAGGLDLTNTSGCRLSNINGADLRSRNGFAAVVHCSGTDDVVGTGIYGTDCDRFIEVEASSHDCTFTTGAGTGIYPNGYGGQPGGYATYSFVLDLGHAHEGEGGCYNISYADFTLTDCLSALTAQRSTGSLEADLSYNLSATDITINSPRGARFPLELQGYNIALDGITFGGTPNTTVTQLIKTLASSLSDSIVIDGLVIPDEFYGQQIALFQAVGSEMRNADIGVRNSSVTTTFYPFRTEANNCVWDGNTIDQPTYGAAIWSFAGGTSGCSRTNNVSTLASMNAITTAAHLNGTTVTESGNQDLVSP